MFEQLKIWKANPSNNNLELVDIFISQVNTLYSHPDFPQKAKTHLDSIIFQLKSLKLASVSIDSQVKIENILSRDIPNSIDAYFSLPKAHAVSVVLDNGKTAKQSLIDQFFSFSQLLSDTIQKDIEEKSNLIVRNESINLKLSSLKKDFFEL